MAWQWHTRTAAAVAALRARLPAGWRADVVPDPYQPGADLICIEYSGSDPAPHHLIRRGDWVTIDPHDMTWTAVAHWPTARRNGRHLETLMRAAFVGWEAA